MEAIITDNLRRITQKRNSILEFTPKYFEISSVFHFLIWFTTIYIFSSVFVQIRKITLFSLHPIFMTLGSVLCLGEGLVSFRNRFLADTLSPIMQHSHRMKTRTIHRTIQIIGCLFLSLGLLFIFAHKAEWNKTLIPMTLHSIFGSFALMLVVIQVISGIKKMEQLDRTNTKVRRWHGESGLLLWDLLCFTIILGLLDFLVTSISTYLLILTIILLWMSAHVQMRKKNANDNDNTSRSPARKDDINEDFVDIETAPLMVDNESERHNV